VAAERSIVAGAAVDQVRRPEVGETGLGADHRAGGMAAPGWASRCPPRTTPRTREDRRAPPATTACLVRGVVEIASLTKCRATLGIADLASPWSNKDTVAYRPDRRLSPSAVEPRSCPLVEDQAHEVDGQIDGPCPNATRRREETPSALDSREPLRHWVRGAVARALLAGRSSTKRRRRGRKRPPETPRRKGPCHTRPMLASSRGARLTDVLGARKPRRVQVLGR